jgi:hypothetical protein
MGSQDESSGETVMSGRGPEATGRRPQILGGKPAAGERTGSVFFGRDGMAAEEADVGRGTSST